MHSVALALLLASTSTASPSFWEVLSAALGGAQRGMTAYQPQPNPYAPRQPYAPPAPPPFTAPAALGCYTDANCGTGAVCIMVAGIGQCVKRAQY